MRTVPVLAFLTLVLAGCDGSTPAAQSGPAQVWEVGGLETPESALPADGVIYVSNVAGTPTEKDGNGYISKVSKEGKILVEKWATGLDAPKGLAISGGKLYASDIDKIVEIDLANGKVLARHEAAGAKFLNDVAADGAGNVYVSDMATNTIWRLSGGKLDAWLVSDALLNPNGLLVQGDKLIVAAWGPMDDMDTIAGRLLKVTIADKGIKPLGSGKAIGHLDGIEPLDAETYLVSDWVSGKVYKINRTGDATEILSLGPGAADLGYDAGSNIAYIPLMKEGKLRAYTIK